MSGSMGLMFVLIGVELVALLLVVLGLSWFRHHAAQRRDAKAMQALVARVRKGRADRETVLRRFLEQSIGLSGDALATTTAGLLRAELALLHRFAGLYRRRDAGSAAQFDIDLQAAVEPYHALSVDQGAEPVLERPDVEIDRSEIGALREQNQRLSDELQITMETMSRMLNEYSTMFSGSEPAGQTAVDARSTGAGATADGEGAPQPHDVGPESDAFAHEEITVVMEEPGPAVEAPSGTGTKRESVSEQGDDHVTTEPDADDAGGRPEFSSGIGPIEDRTRLDRRGDGDTASLFEESDRPPLTTEPSPARDGVDAEQDEARFVGSLSEEEEASEDRGGDVEAWSEAVAGDSALSATGGRTTGPASRGVFDEDDDTLFDSVEPSDDEAPSDDLVDDFDDLDETANRLDRDEAVPAPRGKAGQGVR